MPTGALEAIKVRILTRSTGEQLEEVKVGQATQLVALHCLLGVLVDSGFCQTVNWCCCTLWNASAMRCS